MKLINNRFRVTGVIYQGEIEESYIIKDLQENEKVKFLTIYSGVRNKKVIDYFTEEFYTLVNIKHKNLVRLGEFGIINTINLKKSSSLMYYYVLNEYVESPKLVDLKGKFSLIDKLKIILDLMCVIDYLHFRGFCYKYLSPTNIFLGEDYKVKIRDLASITRDYLYSHHNDLTEIFIAPEIFADSKHVDKYVDYYSIGMVMKYLLFEGLNIEDISRSSFKNEFNLTSSQKVFLKNIISNLTHKDPTFRNLSLKNHIKNIIDTFNLDYEYDLVKERDNLILNANIIGRDKEIKTFLEVEDSLSKGVKKFNGAIISGRPGSGKTKLLNEIAFRYSLSNVSVFHIKGRENLISGGLNIASLLKASFRNAPNEIINKYNQVFNELINTNNTDDDINYGSLSHKSSQEKYMIFNKLTNYFADLSKDRTIYILIDDIYTSNEDFINFLNYMIFKLENNKIFLIITTIDPVLVNNNIMRKNLNLLLGSDSILHEELTDLSEADTGRFIKSILGMNYIPIKFTSFIYKESLGNPNYIYYVIKDIYNRDELYMGENGVWDTREKDYNKIIISIDENHVINSQLESISSDHYKVLELISLSKDLITRKVLGHVLEIKDEDLNPIIKSLIESKIIDDKVTEYSDNLSINSIELKRTVSFRIDNHKKARLHKKLASSIMKLYKDNYQFVMEELVYHLKNSGQNDYALEILLTEANRQTNRYSSYSISLWEDAYSLVKETDKDEVLDILDTLINIYKIKGYVDLTGSYISELQSIAMKKNNIKYIILAMYHQIEVYFTSNQLDVAESMISEVEKLINENQGLYEGRILLLMNKAKLGFDSNKLEGLDKYLNEAIKISKEKKIQKYLGNIYNLLGLYEYLSGNSEKSIGYFNESIKSFEVDSNILEEIKPINNIGNIYGNIYGDYEEALRYYQKGYKIASEYEFARISAVFTLNIGDAYYQNFQLDKAQHYFERSRTIANEIGDYKMYISSNLCLGLTYIKLNRCEEAYEVYKFINEVNSKDPIIDSEILLSYYTFMGEFHSHFGQFTEAINYLSLLSEETKDFSHREYLWSEANILFIKAKQYSEYKRGKIEHIINGFRSTKMNRSTLEMLLAFATVAVEHDDLDFAEEILNIYSYHNAKEDVSLKALRDLVAASIDSDREKLLEVEKNYNNNIFKDYLLYYHTILADEWIRNGNYKNAINHLFKALNNLLKRAESIQDKDLKYSFIDKWSGDGLKKKLTSSIKKEFNKDINYTTLDDLYNRQVKYNDLISILDQMTLDEYRKINNIDGNDGVNSLEKLLFSLTDDYQHNIDTILNYIGYVTLANKGYILSINEDDKGCTIVSSLDKGDLKLPKKNLLNQSNRSDVGILINKNLRNMEDSKYIDLLPEDAVAIICVPLFKSNREIIGNDRRKASAGAFTKNAHLQDRNKLYIYLESDSYLNKFEYENLLLINHIANLIQMNEENKYLKAMTVIDKLTGVLTRKHFDYEIDGIMETNSQYQGEFSLLMIDIDNFKILNDTYGHLAGDDVLSVIGSKLKDSVRSTDLVARYGGEEFIVILFGTNISDGYEIAEKIRKNVLDIKVSGVERQVSISIGLAQYPEHGQSKKDLIRKADQALYNAKEVEGKNRTVVWNIDMSENSNNQDKLSGILTGNINKDNVNISAVINTVAIIEKDLSKDEKISEFTRSILEILEAQYATFIEIGQNGYIYKTKVKNKQEWVKTPKLNKDLICRVIDNKKGEILVDWDNIEILDPITEEPQWQSALVIPLIKKGIVEGLFYLTVPLIDKEFAFEDFNLGSLLSNIFAAALPKD